MSGLASNISTSGLMWQSPQPEPQTEEAAGKVGKILGVIAMIALPFAAPALLGALAGSSAIASGLVAAGGSAFAGGLTSIIGSAAVGAITSAAVAYAGGARGGQVWQAAGIGGLTKGISAAATNVRMPGVVNTTQPVPGAAGGTTAGGTGPLLPTPGGAATTGGPQSGGIMGTLSRMFGNASQLDLNRMGAAILNAAVNGQNMGKLNGLVEQQRAELEQLRNSDRAVYEQRINAAQQILADADRSDPAWTARMRMADVMGVEANEFRQAMRNIATRQGGSLDQGQKNAYERTKSLHTARSKAFAYGKGFEEGKMSQNELRYRGAGMLGPDEAGYRSWVADTNLEADRQRAEADSNESTVAGFSTALFGTRYRPSTSPDPTSDGEDDQIGIFGNNRGPFGIGD